MNGCNGIGLCNVHSIVFEEGVSILEISSFIAFIPKKNETTAQGFLEL